MAEAPSAPLAGLVTTQPSNQPVVQGITTVIETKTIDSTKSENCIDNEEINSPLLQNETSQALEKTVKDQVISSETAENTDKTGKNPFTKSGKLSRKADYIISRSTITRTNIRILDPDLPSQQPILKHTQVSLKAESEANGHIVEVKCVKINSPQSDKAEQVKVLSQKKCCSCCVGCCCECCVKCCGGCCACCKICCTKCRAACAIQ